MATDASKTATHPGRVNVAAPHHAADATAFNVWDTDGEPVLRADL